MLLVHDCNIYLPSIESIRSMLKHVLIRIGLGTGKIMMVIVGKISDNKKICIINKYIKMIHNAQFTVGFAC